MDEDKPSVQHVIQFSDPMDAEIMAEIANKMSASEDVPPNNNQNNTQNNDSNNNNNANLTDTEDNYANNNLLLARDAISPPLPLTLENDTVEDPFYPTDSERTNSISFSGNHRRAQNVVSEKNIPKYNYHYGNNNNNNRSNLNSNVNSNLNSYNNNNNNALNSGNNDNNVNNVSDIVVGSQASHRNVTLSEIDADLIDGIEAALQSNKNSMDTRKNTTDSINLNNNINNDDIYARTNGKMEDTGNFNSNLTTKLNTLKTANNPNNANNANNTDTTTHTQTQTQQQQQQNSIIVDSGSDDEAINDPFTNKIDIPNIPNIPNGNNAGSYSTAGINTAQARVGSIVTSFASTSHNTHNTGVKQHDNLGGKTVDVLDMHGDELEDIELMKEVFLKADFTSISDTNLNNKSNNNNTNNANNMSITQRATSHSFVHLNTQHTAHSSASGHDTRDNTLRQSQVSYTNERDGELTNLNRKSTYKLVYDTYKLGLGSPSSIGPTQHNSNINGINGNKPRVVGSISGAMGGSIITPSLPSGAHNYNYNLFSSSSHIATQGIGIGGGSSGTIGTTGATIGARSGSLKSKTQTGQTGHEYDMSMTGRAVGMRTPSNNAINSNLSNKRNTINDGLINGGSNVDLYESIQLVTDNDLSNVNSNNNGVNNENKQDLSDKPCIVRFMKWYLAPLYTISTLKRLGYHGSNVVISSIFGGFLLLLFLLSLCSLITCCVGILFIYYLFDLSRKIAAIDIKFTMYFFDKIPKFSIYIPNTSHLKYNANIIDKLRFYASDAHMLEILFYLMFLKLPCSLIISGVSLVLVSGVLGVTLSPLMYFIDSYYFQSNNFCLFGSKTTNDDGSIDCDGWAVNSFGGTLGAFAIFLPLLPLALHFSRYTAKLLFRITCHFLTIDLGYGKPQITDQLSPKLGNY